MKHRVALSTLAGVGLLIGWPMHLAIATNPPLQMAQSIWKPFSSSEGGFSVLFPGAPKTTQEMIQYGSELSTELHLFAVDRPQESIVYIVGYADFPFDLSKQTPESISGLFDSVRDGQLQSGQGKLLAEREIQIAGYPGREIKYQEPDGLIGRSRMYAVAGRLYQVLVLVAPSKEKYLTRSIEGFFNSFQLLPG